MSTIFHYEPFYDLDRLFDEASGHGSNNNAQHRPPRISHINTSDGAVRSLKPSMDLHEDARTNIVTATFELPGLKKEDINIDVYNGRLTVSAESKLSTEHEHSGYAVRERRFGRFTRTLQLPHGIKDGEIKASMEHGVLTITFPKFPPETVAKKVIIW